MPKLTPDQRRALSCYTTHALRCAAAAERGIEQSLVDSGLIQEDAKARGFYRITEAGTAALGSYPSVGGRLRENSLNRLLTGS